MALVKNVEKEERAALCLLAGSLLLGFAHVAVLPPWEGFDETAHYSYIQQLADRREIPRLDEARISSDVDRYTRVGPLPYSLENQGGITYEAFFAQSSPDLARARALIHGRPVQPRRYAPGSTHNWETQHPPLYYLVLAPVYTLTRHLGWTMQLLVLRTASYMLAWAALLIGMHACLVASSSARGGVRATWTWAALGVGIWPLVVPGWYPEMARLGNDSLCALILAGVWWLTVGASNRELSWGFAASLGALLGAGCLTKVFFLPVTVACLGFWSVRAWSRGGPRGLVSILPRIATIALVAGVVAGWWYLWNWRDYGVPFGGIEMSELQRRGGLLRGLAEQTSLSSWLTVPVAFGATLVWPGTWSFAAPPMLSYVPLALLLILAAGAYLTVLRRATPASIVFLPAWLACPVLLALGYHALVRMALWGKPQPAYYLHFLAVALGAALGVGLGRLWDNSRLRSLAVGGVTYAVLFGAFVYWAQVMVFSGTMFWPGVNSPRVYRPPAFLQGLPGLPDSLARLEVLAYPWVGVSVWLLGVAFTLAGLALAWRIPGSRSAVS